MNNPISFPLAKLLKEKGFNEPCKNRYWVGYENTVHSQEDCANENWNNYDDESTTYYSRPTTADVVMWIYEKHGIWINVHQENRINGLKITSTGRFQSMINKVNHTTIFGKKSEGNIKEGVYRKPVNTPTESYEAAIEYTLTNLIK